MKTKNFQVQFANCNYKPQTAHQEANCMDDAIILAKAKRIMQNKDHTIHSIREISGRH
jgi:hypothetical protein